MGIEGYVQENMYLCIGIKSIYMYNFEAKTNVNWNELLRVMENDVYSYIKEREKFVSNLIEERFGVNCKDIEAVKRLTQSKRLRLVYDHNGSFIGISSNNRWLYTLDGRVIGKKGKRYIISEE